MQGAKIKILAGTLCAIGIIWIFPSWTYVLDDSPLAFQAKIGSSWIWDPPMPYGATLDLAKNLSYSLAVILAGAGLLAWNAIIRKRAC
jgi:hypothetical protein